MPILPGNQPIRLGLTNKPVIFTHPRIPNPLVIDTGMSEITWPYSLNTNVISTYGGEVVQILSAYVDTMHITGQTKSNDQLKQIYDWFLQYMQIAGLGKRNQNAVHFQYPERGWSFWLQIINLADFMLGFQRIGTPWSIEAQIVTDNDTNYLATYTMSTMTESLFDPSMWSIGFRERDPRNDPGAFDPNFGENLAHNFQSMMGAWTTGDFAHWGFDVLNDTTKNKLKDNAAEYFQNAFGTNFISGNPPASPSGGGSVGYSGTSNTVVGQIAGAFSAKNMPPELGVATAIKESGLNPNATNSLGYFGLFQTQPASSGGKSTANESDLIKVHALNLSVPVDARVSKLYPVEHQVADAAAWFKGAAPSGNVNNLSDSELELWAERAQVGGKYFDFAGALAQARRLIKADRGSSIAGAVSKGNITYPLSIPGTWGGGVAAHMARAFGNWESDHALDILVPQGTPVLACTDGTVRGKIDTSYNPSDNPNGSSAYVTGSNDQWWYTHMISIEPWVRAGRGLYGPDVPVKAGQVIGHTGAANGVYHLHIGERIGDPETTFAFGRRG